jgi:Clostripain family
MARKTPKRGKSKGASTTKQSDWTVMLYMAAGKDEQTEAAAVRDMKELQRVGSTKAVNVLVQIDRPWPGYRQRYRVERGWSQPVADPTLPSERQMSTGDKESLFRFMDWARTSHQANHYMLVLWGHAYGLGFGRDHGDPLTLSELAWALRKFRDEGPTANGGGKNGRLAILGANACAMSYAEAAFELRELAGFLVASEITMPFSGWPYSQILGRLVSQPGIQPQDLGEGILNDFADSFERKGVALTLLNLNLAAPLRKGIEKLAAALTRGIHVNGTSSGIVDAFLDSTHGDVRPIIDLVDLCDNLAAVSDKDVRSAVRSLRTTLKRGKKNALIVDHKADPDFAGLHGLGIFAQSVADPSELKTLEVSETEYRNLKLMAGDNQWPNFVYHDLKDYLQPIRDAVSHIVDRTGAISREDRVGVAQLVIGVGRSYSKFEKALAVAESEVGHLLNGAGANESSPQGARGAVGTYPGTSFLRLLDTLEKPPSGDKQNADRTQVGGHKQQQPRVVAALGALEGALATLEATVTRALTNGTLGLGGGSFEPGLGVLLGAMPSKVGLGTDIGTGTGKAGMGTDIGTGTGKAGMGTDIGTGTGKAGMGTDIGTGTGKAGMGVRERLLDEVQRMGDSQTWTAKDLFSLVAASLVELEISMAALQDAVLAPANDATADGSEGSARHADRVAHVFRSLKAQVSSAKATAVSVLLHPSEGLGPTSQPGFGLQSRQQLAASAGLSPRTLRLL